MVVKYIVEARPEGQDWWLARVREHFALELPF